MQCARAASYFCLTQCTRILCLLMPSSHLLLIQHIDSYSGPSAVTHHLDKSIPRVSSNHIRNTATPALSANSGSMDQTPIFTTVFSSILKIRMHAKNANATRCNCNVSLQHEALRGLIVLFSVLSSQQFVKKPPRGEDASLGLRG